MLSRQMFVRVLAGTVLVTGAWGEIALGQGEDTVVPKPKNTPLPEGIANFKGYFIGNVVSTDDKGCVLKVTQVVAIAGNKATNPNIVVGKNTRVLYHAFGPGKDGNYTPDKDLTRAVLRHSAGGKTITAKVAAERDEALIMNKVWPGADRDPERPDPPRPPAPAPDPVRPAPQPDR